MKKLTNVTVYIEQDEDGLFVGSVPSIPACYAQGKTQAEMLERLREVIALCVRNTTKSTVSRFVGIQNLEINYA